MGCGIEMYAFRRMIYFMLLVNLKIQKLELIKNKIDDEYNKIFVKYSKTRNA